MTVSAFTGGTKRTVPSVPCFDEGAFSKNLTSIFALMLSGELQMCDDAAGIRDFSSSNSLLDASPTVKSGVAEGILGLGSFLSTVTLAVGGWEARSPTGPDTGK